MKPFKNERPEKGGQAVELMLLKHNEKNQSPGANPNANANARASTKLKRNHNNQQQHHNTTERVQGK